jgi:formate dehydrogenase alpha subunit
MNETASIDGRQVDIRPGESILDAAERAGVPVPKLCHDSRVGDSASCRLCVVKVDGRRLPVASCAQQLDPGMEVTTHDDDLDAWRRTVLSLALSELPEEECPKCVEQGPCALHALADDLDVASDRFTGITSGTQSDDANPFILRDYSKCISCYLCTRVCGELEQAHAIAPAGRGFQTRIASPFDTVLLDSRCTFCGQCIQVCPTGVLMDRKMAGKARADEVSEVRTICPFCGVGCGINLRVAGGKVIGVTPDRGSPASEGSLCVKGQFGTDFIHSRDRLTTPLVRRNGDLEPATWDEAYNLIADRFNWIKRESGPDAFALWSSARATNESNYLMQKLARAVIGTNNIDNCART